MWMCQHRKEGERERERERDRCQKLLITFAGLFERIVQVMKSFTKKVKGELKTGASIW